ncbi:MAG: hypothetical protein JRI45_10315 [Deltaproteobacteria bacterium]|nr:hypothetical protein [Deltaproteobacteria bacterium]MBW2067647.1 hypothetical protein [Deltaproteobacteria bacterium]
MVVLLDALSRLTAVNFPQGNLLNQWNAWLKQLERLLQKDEELRNIIETLRQQADQPLRALPGTHHSMSSPQQEPKIIHIDDFIKKSVKTIPPPQTNNTLPPPS